MRLPQGSQAVITSYSIHYTKLYEFERGNGVAPREIESVKITTRGRYAVMALVSLAGASHGNPVSLKDISRQEDISELYLQQLFARLRRQT